jgi:hypothetical protein
VTTTAPSASLAALTAATAFRLAMVALDTAPDTTSEAEEAELAHQYREAERAWILTPAANASGVLDKLRHVWRDETMPPELWEQAAIIGDLHRLAVRQ